MASDTGYLVSAVRVIADLMVADANAKAAALGRRLSPYPSNDVDCIRKLCDRMDALLQVIPRDVERSLAALNSQVWRYSGEPLDISRVAAVADAAFSYGGAVTVRWAA